jgi:hypothetical protein
MDRDFDYLWWDGAKWERRDAVIGTLPNPLLGPARFPDDVLEQVRQQPVRMPPPPLASALPPPPMPPPPTASSFSHLPPPPTSSAIPSVRFETQTNPTSASAAEAIGLTATNPDLSESTVTSTCPSCKSAIKPDAGFCGKCGARMANQ